MTTFEEILGIKPNKDKEYLKQHIKKDRVPSYRKQVEYGPKKFIKP